MKKFVQQFVPEYNRISGMDSFAEHDINKRFLFTNGAIISTIGIIIFLLVGWIFQLLGNQSYIFYGYNAIFIITLFLLIYSTEVKRHEDVDEPYSMWVMIISRGFRIMNAMVVMWSVLFLLLSVQIFTGLEGTIYNIVVILYLIVSVWLRREFEDLLVGIPLVLLMAAFLLLLGSFPMVVQYGVSLLLVSLAFYFKDSIATSMFSTSKSAALMLSVVSIVLFAATIRDNDVVEDGLEPIGNVVLELSSDQSNSDIDLNIQYFGYSFATRYEEEFSMIDIYNDHFELVTSYQVDTTNRISSYVNFKNDTIQFLFKDSDNQYEYRTLEINSLLEVNDLGLLAYDYNSQGEQYTISDDDVIGDVIYQNMDYIITGVRRESNLHIYKRISTGYEYQGDIDSAITYGVYGEGYIRILYMIDDLFVFGLNVNDDILLYIYDTKGNMIGGTYTGSDSYRGSETHFSRSTSSDSSRWIYGIYYNDDGTPIISYYGSSSGRQLYDVERIYTSTLSLWSAFKNNTEVASLLLLCGLLIPISKKEGE